MTTTEGYISDTIKGAEKLRKSVKRGNFHKPQLAYAYTCLVLIIDIRKKRDKSVQFREV